MLQTILLIILVLILLGALPGLPWTAGWGVGAWPSATALVLIILILVML